MKTILSSTCHLSRRLSLLEFLLIAFTMVKITVFSKHAQSNMTASDTVTQLVSPFKGHASTLVIPQQNEKMLQVPKARLGVVIIRDHPNLQFLCCKKSKHRNSTTPRITVTDTDNITRTAEHAEALQELKIYRIAYYMNERWILACAKTIYARELLSEKFAIRVVLSIKVEILEEILVKEEKAYWAREGRQKKVAWAKKTWEGVRKGF